MREDCAAFSSSSFEFSLGCSSSSARRARAEVYKKGGSGKCTRGFGFRVGNFFLFCLGLFRVYRFFVLSTLFLVPKSFKNEKHAHTNTTQTHITRARALLYRERKSKWCILR